MSETNQPESGTPIMEPQYLTSRDGEEIQRQLQIVNAQLEILNATPLLKYRPPSFLRELLQHLFKGILFGLGSFLGATLVVSLVIYLLSSVEFVPYIGDIVKRILVEIQK